jgi:phage replication-related protein YjqB (UPF0714/DUF867 family)
MNDKYSNFSNLNKTEKESDFEIISKEGKINEVAIIAIHGGKIEKGTSEIAEVLARNNYSFYTFKGKKKSNNFKDLHIKSTNFNEPKALSLVIKSKYTISIHGTGKSKIIIGGHDDKIVKYIEKKLSSNGYELGKDNNMDASNKNNICNKNALGKGVQIEIPNKLRNKMFADYKKPNIDNATKIFYTFINIIDECIKVHLSAKK